MAQSKSFFGLRRGSTKTLTFQVNNGKQITKDRVEYVRNPRTNAQMYQRAIMSTVMQAYSKGKEIFDHSFEGVSKGAGCQRKFMTLNASIVRGLLAADVQGNVTELNAAAHLVVPKSKFPAPNPYIISEGSYPQNFFSKNTEGTGFTFPDKTAEMTCAQYCNMNGLVPGDIYTIVSFTFATLPKDVEDPDRMKKNADCFFGFVRLMVKENALTDETVIGSNLAQDVPADGTPFAITDRRNSTAPRTIVWDRSEAVSLSELGFPGDNGCIGVIRSRFDQDLRSNSQMFMVVSNTNIKENTGLVYPHILPVWKAGTISIGDSDLILEGGE